MPIETFHPLSSTTIEIETFKRIRQPHFGPAYCWQPIFFIDYIYIIQARL